MNASFYNGVLGVKAHQFGLDVWANNIANINTIGFKSYTPEFASIFATTLQEAYFEPTSNDKGLGTRAQTTALNLSQGVFQTTDRIFDLAIENEGWFGVLGQNQATVYTRAGEFSVDKAGYLVDKNGYYLLATSGNNLTPTTLSQDKLAQFASNVQALQPFALKSILSDVALGNVGDQTKVQLPDYLYLPPQATTSIAYSANLDPTMMYDKASNEIANTEHFSTYIIAPDGSKNMLDLTFVKKIPQATQGSIWDVKAYILSYDKNDAPTTYDPTLYYKNPSDNKVYKIIDAKEGVLSFGNAGELAGNTLPSLLNHGLAMNLDLGEVGSFNGMSASASINKTPSSTHNGYTEGFLRGYGMDAYGNIIAQFDNGKNSAIAKLAVYHFQNDQGLMHASSTYFSPSSNSGNPIFYTKNDGQTFLGSRIHSSALEGSNVSMATALTELIVMQKAFDANAKSITTSDQLIQNAINMKK